MAAFIDGCAHQFSRSFAGDVLSPVRTSSQCWCSHNECDRDPLTHVVARRIANVTRTASERYMEPFQVLKYQPGQFYRTHHDQNSGLFTPQARSPVTTPTAHREHVGYSPPMQSAGLYASCSTCDTTYYRDLLP